MEHSSSKWTRTEWNRHLFPDGIPSLWCPPLTHYTPDGAIDSARIWAHLRFLSPWVKGLLVPGSTGDGWELRQEEADILLTIVLEAVQELKFRLLIGALRPTGTEAAQVITATGGALQRRVGTDRLQDWLARSRVCGFAICPPRGEAVTQHQMEKELSGVLELGLPVALYQLPQVTQNEMSPALVARLAARFGNFVLFKDTSGRDAVASSGQDFKGLFLVRGMEGQYDRWLRAGGGPYHGFLLSAANCFAKQLHQVAQDLAAGRKAQAHALSERISAVVTAVFALVKDLPDGNAFANGNKAMDHFFAHGPRAMEIQPPRLHSGGSLPPEVIRATGAVLERHGLMPAAGYLPGIENCCRAGGAP